ncbi:hypothetical protein PR002_g24845 [Phytophthora rubi]|uniref:Reverse transcriptase Ty1/copia-type domain-containing protein n=2 Tax=Phytophthora TaxID=4783 RepID=A0A6A3I5C0_9STRA|nr:hypothetical protein PR002_g24845 [Phytophthora rubi]
MSAVCSVTAPDPRNYSEAMHDKRADKGKVGMEEKIGALENNQTVLHSNSVYTTKKHADGSVERYKGRLVASGNEQSYSVDYTDTFLSVLGMTTGKVIFALAHIWGVPATCRMRMEISKEKLAELGVQHKRELVLRLKESMYGFK